MTNGTVRGRARLNFGTLDHEPPTCGSSKWSFERTYWGSKFGEEALRYLISAAFKNLRLFELFAVIDLKNMYSIELVTRLKFETVGTKKPTGI
jgi:RimJ/RimL family protein N-acetyltransferase